MVRPTLATLVLLVGALPASPAAAAAAGADGVEVGWICRVPKEGYLQRGRGREIRLEATRSDPGGRSCPAIGPQQEAGTPRRLSLEPVRLDDTLRAGPERGSRLEVKLDQDGLLLLGVSTRVTLEAPGTYPREACSQVTVAQARMDHGALLLHHRERALGPRVVDIVTPRALICPQGTDLLVLHDRRTGTTSVRVDEGRVRVVPHGGEESYLLGPGEQQDFPPPEPVEAAERWRTVASSLASPSERLLFDSPLLDLFDLSGAVVP